MNIVITGANGLLGTELIHQLLPTDHKIYALTSNKEALQSKWNEEIQVHSLSEWEKGIFTFEEIDVVIHCAFARAHKGGEEIANALLFTKKLFDDLKVKRVPNLINISTQEVYGKKASPWRESNVVEPNTIYGTAKYFTELLANDYSHGNDLNSTNIRLAGLLSKDTDARMVNKFVDQTLNGNPIKILDGKLVFSQLDVRDAAAGILALLTIPGKNWSPVYNLGYTKSYSIQEIAQVVQEVGKTYGKIVEIFKEESNAELYAELDSSKLYNDTEWTPQYDMSDIAKSIFEFKLK
ncbi:MAG: NAD(P)-dependent oxidoreductase [Weeksellaceae bacterium]